jgi:type II restriction enzyme
VDLALPVEGLERYHSRSQMARVATESWAAANLFCVNCESPRLTASPTGSRALDYLCPSCDDSFQLKSQSKPFGERVLDSAYSAMMAAIAADRTPHFVLLHYSRELWSVLDLVFIPRFAIPKSAIEKRKPLSSTARRAGWVGCNIVLTQIPQDARLSLVRNGVVERPSAVRRRFERIRPLAQLRPEERGWTLDVLTAVRGLGRGEFSLADMYAREGELAKLHPANQHVRDKIRQQLQVLRNKGLLEFVGRGQYRLTRWS